MRGDHDAGSCPPAVQFTAKDECDKLYGMLEREARVADLSITCEAEVQVLESAFGAEGYDISTVGMNEAAIKTSMEVQDRHDIALNK